MWGRGGGEESVQLGNPVLHMEEEEEVQLGNPVLYMEDYEEESVQLGNPVLHLVEEDVFLDPIGKKGIGMLPGLSSR